MDLSSSGSWSRGGLVGRQIGPYQVVNEIARGGQGVVLEVRHIELDYPAALKLLTVVTPQSIARFQYEAEVLARLDHPNIPKLRDHGTFGATPFIALELVEGDTLERALGQGKLTREQAVEIIEIVAETLEDCHLRGVVHRDLKPGNIVVDAELSPWLLDFGLAKGDRDQRLSLTGEIVGTPGFMAPEQCGGEVSEQADPRTDVYGLGALLYFALTGVPPHDGVSVVNVIKKILEEEPVHPTQYEPDTPVRLSLLCLQALSKDPVERPQSAGEFAESLARWRRYGDRTPGGGANLVIALTTVIVVALIGLAAALAFRAHDRTAPTPSASPVAAATDAPPTTTPTAGPTPAPTPTSTRPRGTAIPDPRYKIRWSMSAPERKGRRRHLARAIGPWIVVKHQKGRWALKARDGERVALPSGSLFNWDRGAERFVYQHKLEIRTWDPKTGGDPVRLGKVRRLNSLAGANGRAVVTTKGRRMLCLTPEGEAWSIGLPGRVDARPLPIDIDADGKDDHVLYATAQGATGLVALADGAVRCVGRLPGPVRHGALVVGKRDGAGAVPVVVACVDGHVVRLDVSRGSISVRGAMALHTAIRTPPMLVRQGNRPHAVTFGLQHWGLAAAPLDAKEIAWAEPPLRRGAQVIDLTAVDLDGDGLEEVAAVWTVHHKASFLSLHDPQGRPVDTHDEEEARPWGGVAAANDVLVGARKGRIEGWGWARPFESADRPADLGRARFLMVSGAWSAARAEAKRLESRPARILAALAAGGRDGAQAMAAEMMGLGVQRNPMRVSMEFQTELMQIGQAAGNGFAAHLALRRLRATMPSPFPMPDVNVYDQPGSAVTTKPLTGKGAALEVRVHTKAIDARGFTGVGVSDAQAKFGRHTFHAGGWLGVKLRLDRPQRFKLALRHKTVSSFNWGFSAVRIKVDDRVEVPHWSAPRHLHWDAIELPKLKAGEHRIVVEVHERTATIYELRGLRLVPLAD